MYPNQYGNQPPQNIGFNSNFGQQGGVPPYSGQAPGGLPYPVQPSGGAGFTPNQSPYPSQGGGVYPPQLPSAGVTYPTYPPAQQQPGYPSSQPSYPPAPQAGPYPPPTSGYNPNPHGSYPSVPNPTSGGAYPPQPTSVGYPPTSGYPPAQAPPTSGYPSAQAPPTSGYPPSQAPPTSGYVGYPPGPGQQPPQSGAYGSPAHQPIYPTTTYGSAAAPPHQPAAYPHSASSFGSTAPTPSSYPQQQQAYSQQFTATQAHSYGADPHSANRGGVATAQRMQPYVEKPTIVGGHFDPAGDAQVLRNAMKGFGTDEAAILRVICRRSNAQRLQIANAFKTSFGKDLIKDLKSELGGRFEQVVLALMTPRFDFLAMTLQKAISGIGTRERPLVDILCTASNEEIRLISASYARLYGRHLERDLSGDTSGHFRRLLVSVCNAGRMESQPADQGMATTDAQALYNAGVNKIGTDEATFNQILCLRSFQHLRLVFHEYERTYGQSFEKVIENEFSGDIASGLKAVVACAKNRAAYFASRLHESFAGFGTQDDDLIFIMVTRCEIDLLNIKEEYQRNYNKTLGSAIASETSGDYKKALIALLGE